MTDLKNFSNDENPLFMIESLFQPEGQIRHA